MTKTKRPDGCSATWRGAMLGLMAVQDKDGAEVVDIGPGRACLEEVIDRLEAGIAVIAVEREGRGKCELAVAATLGARHHRRLAAGEDDDGLRKGAIAESTSATSRDSPSIALDRIAASMPLVRASAAAASSETPAEAMM